MAQRQSRSVWEDAGTEYNPEAPAVRSAVKSERWKRRVLGVLAFVAVPLATISGMAAFSAASRDAGAGLDAATASVLTNDSPGKSVAYTAVQGWVDGDPSPLPGAEVLSWDGYTREEAPTPESGDDPIGYHFEQHRFTAARGGVIYLITVQVAVGENGSAVATGTPSLLQSAGLAPDGAIVSWFGLATMNADDGVREAVASWADAYTSGDPALLRRAIQDREAGRSYMPLTGVAGVLSVQVLSAAYDPARFDDAEDASEIVARVQVTFDWGVAIADGEPRTGAPVSYDVLIADADTATPYVVAWGGVGSGGELEPYQNAIGEVSLVLPSNAPTPRPTETDGGEG